MRGRSWRVCMFRTEESQRRYIAAYDAVLAAWPVPFESNADGP